MSATLQERLAVPVRRIQEPREKKMSWSEAALAAACDPFGWFCVYLPLAKSWKVGFIFLAVLAAVGLISGVVILWVRRHAR
jgi:hypothetical protein